jgi:hypothetical protein
MSSSTPLCGLGEYAPELIDLLTEAIPSGQAVSATALAVDPAIYQTEQELVGERRCVDALIRKHWNHCVARGIINGTCEIVFHPETGVPQVFATQRTPEDSYSAGEQAQELLGALITDHWCPGEAPLIMETWMMVLAGGEAIDSFDPRLVKQSATITGGLVELSHHLLLCLALISWLSPDDALRRFALMDRSPINDLLGPHPDYQSVEAARAHIMATFAWSDGPERE